MILLMVNLCTLYANPWTPLLRIIYWKINEVHKLVIWSIIAFGIKKVGLFIFTARKVKF